jgi:hypothetical protein
VVIAHEVLDRQGDLRLTRAAIGNGEIVSREDLTIDLESPTALALAANGDRILGGASLSADGIARLDANDATVWGASMSNFVAGVGVMPNGDVVAATSRNSSDQDADAELAAFDGQSGANLWTCSYGGEAAANGFSLDFARTLAIDQEGNMFLGVVEYVDWDTLAPVVVAYPQGGQCEPNWVTSIVDMPGQDLYMRDLAVDDEGLLVAIFQRYDGTWPFWVAGLDATSGEVAWVVERDDLGLPVPLDFSYVGGVAIAGERIAVVGFWHTELDGVTFPQAFVLEFDREGNLVCHSTIDDYDAEAGVFEHQLNPLDVVAAADGTFVLGGYGEPFWNPMLDTELLLAKFH